jgi:hypothetical protein
MTGRYVTVALLTFVLSLMLTVMANAAPGPSEPPTGWADGRVSCPNSSFPEAIIGDRNVVLDSFSVEEISSDGNPLEIEYICVQKAAGSTLLDEYIFQLKLAIGDDGDGEFDEADEPVLGIIRRPDFDADFDRDGIVDGACFGVPGRVLAEVPDGESLDFLILADLRSDAPDLLTFQPVITVVASDSLLGGADVSSGFQSGLEFCLGQINVMDNTTGDPTGQILPEPNDVEAEPGASGIVLGQFQIENRAEMEPTYPLLIQHITLFLTGYRDGEPNPDVLKGIKSISIYKDTGATAPGFSRGDRRIWSLTKPTLRGQFITAADGTEKLELVAGYRGRRLMRIGLPPEEPGVERIYVVADLGTEFQDGDYIKLEIIAGAKDSPIEDSAAFDLAPGEMVSAYNPTYIVAPAATLVIGSTTVSSGGKLIVSMKNIPAPGLESLMATFIYDSTVADVAVDTLGNPKVRAFGNYEVLASGGDGELTVIVNLKAGRKAATGDFDLLEIEFEAVGEAGEWTEITADPWSLIANSGDLTLDISPGKIEVRLIKGDVNGDGVVTRADAREVALFILGRSDLDWTIIRQRQADVAAPFCNPDFLIDGAEVAPACIDATDVRMIMLAAYGHVTLGAAAVEPLQVKAIALSQNSNDFTLTVTGRGVATVGLKLYSLAGGLVLEREAQGNMLQFQLNGPSGAWANGVYLYVVTVKGYDGSILRSEVRKLVIVR